MTATILSPEDIAHANTLAMQIGEAFRRERLARGHDFHEVAAALGLNPKYRYTLAQFEEGAYTDVKLATIVRNLGLYGYTLAVVPIGQTPDMRNSQ